MSAVLSFLRREPSAAQPRPLLSFKDVGKSFPPGVRALEAVSFNVAPGEFCVLLGRSGAGKSTLLRAVNGLTDTTSGEVVFDGKRVSSKSLREVRQRVSMIHQQFNLVPRSSVAANVLSGALAQAAWWRSASAWYPAALRRKCWSLIRRVGLDETQVFRRVQDLSGGQQQRVGIARALMLDPDLILADEPVASLDPKVSRDVLSLLHSAAKERGAAVLCSLHQLDLAQEFADRIVAVHAGQVVFDGPPGELTPAVIRRVYEMSDDDTSVARHLAAMPAAVPEPTVDQRIDYVLGRLSRFTETVSSAGRKSERRVLDKRVETAAGTVAGKLGLAPDDSVIRIDTLRLLDGSAMGMSSHHLTDPKCRLALDLYDGGELHALLATLSIVLVRRDSTLAVLPASAETAAHLGLAPGALHLVVESVNVDAATGEAVEFVVSRFRPEAIRFLITL
ncbi:MAG: phosphonate ABC transporter ATP-binding protein [Proteobacteria bacterium]|nr:phosphonate ABC transporter ATP-binding protein [Burkholderiales bacterium]